MVRLSSASPCAFSYEHPGSKSESDSEDFPGGFKFKNFKLKMPTSLSECHWQWALSWTSGDLLLLVFSCLPEL